jgi:hypothetical protein
MGPSPAVSIKRAQVAGLTLGVRTGKRQPDAPELLDAKRGLAAAKIEDYITRVLAEPPPLTDAQRTALAELLRPVRVPGGAA